MNRTTILDFAQALALGAPDRTSTAQWLQFRCPLAQWKHKGGRDNTASFGIRVEEYQHSHYWCFSCHSKGEFHQLAFELAQLRGQPDLIRVGEEIRRQEFIGPRFVAPKWDAEVDNLNETAKDQIVWPEPWEAYAYLSAAGHPYLRERGIDWSTAVSLDLRYHPRQRRILFPVRDYTGRFAGFTGRRVDPPAFYDDEGVGYEQDGRPYLKVRDFAGLRKREFLLGEHRIRIKPKHRRIVLVEGLFDYAFLTRSGVPNVVALLGSYLTPEKGNKLIMFGQPVVLFLDNDQAGADCVHDCITKLFGRVPLLTVKYPDGYDGADPASLPPQVIHRMYDVAELVIRPS